MCCFVCPRCGGKLQKRENSLYCPQGHCFDMAKSGYVNLLQNHQSADKRHGDDKCMVAARRDFLDAGYYDPLVTAVAAAAAVCTGDGGVILDAGCGECKYTGAVAEAVSGKAGVTVCGVDISKDAVNYGAKRDRRLQLAVAGVTHMPVGDGTVQTLMSVFAPAAEEEFRRVLAPGGAYIKVIPLEDHLYELKAAVYDRPYRNEVPDTVPAGFTLEKTTDLRYPMTLESAADILHLFMMTPYYYKTGRQDQEKLQHLTRLTVTAAFRILIYRRK